jgi:hypothetical protein
MLEDARQALQESNALLISSLHFAIRRDACGRTPADRLCSRFRILLGCAMLAAFTAMGGTQAMAAGDGWRWRIAALKPGTLAIDMAG